VAVQQPVDHSREQCEREAESEESENETKEAHTEPSPEPQPGPETLCRRRAGRRTCDARRRALRAGGTRNDGRLRSRRYGERHEAIPTGRLVADDAVGIDEDEIPGDDRDELEDSAGPVEPEEVGGLGQADGTKPHIRHLRRRERADGDGVLVELGSGRDGTRQRHAGKNENSDDDEQITHFFGPPLSQSGVTYPATIPSTTYYSIINTYLSSTHRTLACQIEA